VRSAPRAYTLVELLVVLTITSLVLTSVAVALTSLFRAEGNIRDRVNRAEIHARLGFQLRSDAHRASAVAPLPGENAPHGFVLSGPDGLRVEYRTGAERVVRTVSRGDQIAHRDSFRLADQRRAEYEITGPPDRLLVSILIRHDPSAGRFPDNASADPRIVAAVGLDRRWAP
jgi:prepilin-type N-terminal cleavage/methylation domain-containing protein